MAATLLKTDADMILGGTRRTAIFKVTGDASYATGGYAITAAQFGLRALLGVLLLGTYTSGASTYGAVYNATTGKLVFTVNGSEVTNATDIHTISVLVAAVSTDD